MPTDTEQVIDPCPFCTGEGALAETEDDGYARVLCVCTAMGPLRMGEEAAIAAWNTLTLARQYRGGDETLVDRLLRECASRKNTVAAREAMEEAADRLRGIVR